MTLYKLLQCLETRLNTKLLLGFNRDYSEWCVMDTNGDVILMTDSEQNLIDAILGRGLGVG